MRTNLTENDYCWIRNTTGTPVWLERNAVVAKVQEPSQNSLGVRTIFGSESPEVELEYIAEEITH